MLHAVASILHTLNVEKTTIFLRDTLNFNVEFRHEHWYANNGSVSLLLLESEDEHCSTLHIQSSNFDNDITSLQERGDVHSCGNPDICEEITSQLFTCDCGIKLFVFHELDEDERNELLPLPITLDWDDSVIISTQRILRVTPIAFRDKARINTTERAEYLAVSEGNFSVSTANAMQALTEITPEFQHRALFEAMLAEGIEASLYIDSKAWANSGEANA